MPEWIEVVSKVVGIIGALIAASGAVWQMYRRSVQQAREFRWNQAKLSKELLDEAYAIKHVADALRMLDWSGRKYTVADNERVPITFDDVETALRTSDLRFTNKEAYIRDCFDELFELLERLEHFIRIELIHFDDVRVPLEYYRDKIAANRDVHQGFMNAYDYDLAPKFLARFELGAR